MLQQQREGSKNKTGEQAAVAAAAAPRAGAVSAPMLPGRLLLLPPHTAHQAGWLTGSVAQPVGAAPHPGVVGQELQAGRTAGGCKGRWVGCSHQKMLPGGLLLLSNSTKPAVVVPPGQR